MNEKSSQRLMRGVHALGASDLADLRRQVEALLVRLRAGSRIADGGAIACLRKSPERVVVDFAGVPDLMRKLTLVVRALEREDLRPLLDAQGVFWGRGALGGKLAFLFPGQGGHYVGMGRELAARVPAFAETLAEADRAMLPLLGFRLCERFLRVGDHRPDLDGVEESFHDISFVQPAILALSTAIARLLHGHGVRPDFVFGHSLGEYSGLVEAQTLRYPDALHIVSFLHPAVRAATQRCGGVLAVLLAPATEVQSALAAVRPTVALANINSDGQSVVGGPQPAVERVCGILQARGFEGRPIPATHAFHTPYTKPVAEGLRQLLRDYPVQPPRVPVIAGVTGRPYPADVESVKDLLARQAAETVQWSKGIAHLYRAGVRTFVEVGPKRALKGLVDSLLGKHGDVVSLFTCHPKHGEATSFHRALCGLLAAGYGDPARLQHDGCGDGGEAWPPSGATDEERAHGATTALPPGC